MDSLVIGSFLCVLVALINQVTGDLQVSCTQDRFILEENVAFALKCIASYSDNKDISGSFTWRYESHITGSVAVKDDDNNDIVTTSGNGKKQLISTLTVANPPNVPNVLFYYHAKVTVPGESDEESFPVRLLKETSIPTPKVSNSTDFVVALETTVKFRDKVKLTCQMSYNNTNHNTDNKFEIALSWRKRNDPHSDLVEKTLSYKSGNNMEELQHHITIEKSSDGGEYFCQADLYTTSNKNKKQNVIRTANIKVKIQPGIKGGQKEKEITKNAGEDVELHCDIIGYPIVYEWQDENGQVISGKNDSRIQINENVLSIDDIDYSDRKKYICVGKMGDFSLEQIIILRVKDPLAALWPFIGILIETILIILIIWGAQYIKSKKTSKTDGDASGSTTGGTEPAASSTNA